MRKSAINRILLALVGIVLMGAGLLMLAGGFDVYREWRLAPPSGWPLTRGEAVLLSAADRDRWTREGWWWPVVIAALAVVLLLALWWLLAQLHRSRPGPVPLRGEPGVAGAELRESALSEALAADVRRQPGVAGAQARLVGTRRHPTADLDVTLSPDGEPQAVMRTLCEGPLARARQSTGWADLPARARLRVTPHKPHRAA
ncbi:alkaline shock response membrane anchor protein AmaP [Streptomyces sp. cmx-4-9]|uniref:alkaline shock response membrane anchor protein AmaP n=1 Tax=Streptomyces sp. cmx-4-9 TaxID=2790941 RepID=UPI0039804B1D